MSEIHPYRSQKFFSMAVNFRILLLPLPCQLELSFFCFYTIRLVKILHMTKLLGTYCSSDTYKK